MTADLAPQNMRRIQGDPLGQRHTKRQVSLRKMTFPARIGQPTRTPAPLHGVTAPLGSAPTRGVQ